MKKVLFCLLISICTVVHAGVPPKTPIKVDTIGWVPWLYLGSDVVSFHVAIILRSGIAVVDKHVEGPMLNDLYSYGHGCKIIIEQLNVRLKSGVIVRRPPRVYYIG